MNLRTLAHLLLNSSNERTQLIKRNIVGITLLRGLSILIAFLLVPMTINYLTPTEYGIWLTLNSILTWTSILDLGLGHGLRNKMAEAYALNDFKKIQVYVSTSFFVLSIIAFILFLIFAILNYFINWANLLNIDSVTGDSLNKIALWVMFFFCVQLVMRIIGMITMANQRPVLSALINVAGNFLALCVIGLLINFTKGNLLYVAVVFSAAPVVTCLLFGYFMFEGRYKNIRPSIRLINLKYMKDIVGLGGKFFIIQISSMFIFTYSNVLISNFLGPSNVTVYNITYKYFSIVTMLFTIITTPLWSAFTDAYVKKDYVWMKKVIRQMNVFWFLSLLATILMLILSSTMFRLWIGDNLKVSFSISCLIAIYTAVYNLHTVYISVINGVGKIFIQWLYWMFAVFVFVPLSIYLCKLYGVEGIVSAMITVSLPLVIISIIQCNKLIDNKAVGLWLK